MATVKGTWIFNEKPLKPNSVVECLLNEPLILVGGSYERGLSVQPIGRNDGDFVFSDVDEGGIYTYSGGMPEAILYSFTTGTWVDESNRTINFGKNEQEISDTFYTWFIANATQQTSEPGIVPVTFDLSTLNLPAGTHSITVKARASGYADSAESNAVSYVVELPQLNPATIALNGDVLTITNISGNASTATIYVDGVEKTTVEVK